MTDIDFDELDRAVNSLMDSKSTSSDKKPTPPAESTDEPVAAPASVSEPATEDVPAEAEAPVESPAAEETQAEEPVTSSPTIVAKKRGQFMDVMHPSADMRSRPTSASATPVSRTSTVLQPSAKFEKAMDAVQTSPDVAPPVTPSVPADEPESTPNETLSSEWPDPIDLAPPAEPNPAAPDTDEPAEVAPPVSPFLPDAKVEKRPLGGTMSAPDDQASEPIDEAVSEGADDTTSANQDTPPDSVIPMPAELGSDIMNVESGGMPTSAPAPVPVQPLKDADDSARPSGPSSIPQQYQASEPAEADHHAALYDTAAHQDLTHPTKKKSGWLIPVIILILLVLGAAGGYFAYTMNLFR